MSAALLVPRAPAGRISGGLLTQRRFAEAIGARVVEYDAQRSAASALPEQLAVLGRDEVVIVGFGSHAARLLPHLSDLRVAYWANSLGWRFTLPPDVAVLAASRYSLGYWGEVAPNNQLYYLPNILEDDFSFSSGVDREVDVLVQRRKTSRYVLEQLVPALEPHVSVRVLDRSPDLAAEFKQAKVYLYDSVEFWRRRGVSEGFGLPPAEAAACGCHVFSSLNAGLSDYVDPGNGYSKLRVQSLEHDVTRIRAAVQTFAPVDRSARFAEYRAAAVAARWAGIERSIDEASAAAVSARRTVPDVQPFRGYRSIRSRRGFHLARALRSRSRFL